MDPKTTQEILDDLIPSFEALEAKSSAVLEFLKHEGIASDEKLAPYLDQAENASSVRWLGVRVRIERLLAAAEKESAEKSADAEKEPKKSSTDKEDKKPEAAEEKPREAAVGKSESDDKTDKNKDAAATLEPTAKSDDTTNQDDKNSDRARHGERNSTSTVSTADQKVA